jgi:serine/threonine-protein kinase
VSEEARLVIPDLQRIGKYDVLERIADGGFATLYRGRDPFLKRLVAIKVCASDDAELRQQFLREAEIAGNLDHPSIVRTFDFGFDPVGPYLVQEYLQGEDLSYLIAHRVRLSTRRKLDLLVQIAEGLGYSHDRLVLHLDVKPGNVRVLGRRQAKILDFGIARLANSGAPTTGAMVGTAGYVAPEQVMSKTVDARSDVFAFGALAYELLTFARPFAGGTIGELLKRVLASEAEPITRHWPDCDEALANLVGRCLRRDPNGRYPSFELLLTELIAIRDSYPEVEPMSEPIAPEAAPASPGRHSDANDDPSRTVEVAIPSHAEADRVESAAVASSSAEPTPADTIPLGASPATSKRRAAGSKKTLILGLAAAATVVAIAIAVFLPPPEPIAAAEPAAADVIVPPRSSGPAPGLLVVTAAPWGQVTRLSGADGTPVELPNEHTTPLRLWVAPGLHHAEVTLAGGAVATCAVDVGTGGTHLCAATAVEEGAVPGGTDYFKEMGWWQ